MHRIDILKADSATLAAAYRTGELSPIEVTEVVLAAADEAGRRYSALTESNTDDARASAFESHRRHRAGAPLGPLDGVPVSVKDSIRVRGLKRWHGTAASDHLPPSVDDGAPVSRLREAGAIPFAKSAMAEMGALDSGLSSQFGVARNPWNPSRTTGGSSSGAAALLAAGVGPMAIGTDMAGSVRLPAHQCGVVGFKPSQGRVAYDPGKLYGVAGPMARTVADARRLLEVIGAHDPRDLLSMPGRFSPTPTKPLARSRIGVWSAVGYGPDVEAAVLEALESQVAVLERAGAEVVRVDAPFTPDDLAAIHDFYNGKTAFEYAALSPDLQAKVLPQLRAIVEPLLERTAIDFQRAEAHVLRVREGFARLISGFDAVLSPVKPTVSFAAERTGPVPDASPLHHLGFTKWLNVVGFPAGTVPVALTPDREPIGVQIAAGRNEDAVVLDILEALEDERGPFADYPIVESEARA